MFAAISEDNCYCTNTFGATGLSTSCQTTCAGNSGQICGGPYEYVLYQLNAGQPAGLRNLIYEHVQNNGFLELLILVVSMKKFLGLQTKLLELLIHFLIMETQRCDKS